MEKREKIFELNLPVLVRGINAFRNYFEEKTTLSAISCLETSFLLDTPVSIGTTLKLSVEIPYNIFLEGKYKLLISGNVFYVKAEKDKIKKQNVFIRLDKEYKIISNS